MCESPIFVVGVCVCVRARLCVRAFARARVCVCVCVCVRAHTNRFLPFELVWRQECLTQQVASPFQRLLYRFAWALSEPGEVFVEVNKDLHVSREF